MNATKEWPAILQFETGATITESLVEEHYRKLAKKYHPDAGGSTDDMQQLNLAKQFALQWVKKEREKLALLQELAERQRIALAQAQRANNAMSQQMAAMQNHWTQSIGGMGMNAFANQAANTAAPTQTEPTPAASKRDWLGKVLATLKKSFS